MERHHGATLLARERRLRIDGRFEISSAGQETLRGLGAVVDGVQRNDIALMNGQLANGVVSIGAGQSIESNFADAVVDE